MIDEKIILKKIDERIGIQNRHIERIIQGSNNQAELALLERELATYLYVKKLIKETRENEAEHMFNLDKKVMEATLYMLCNQNKEGKQKIGEVCFEIANDMLDRVTPMTNRTALYMIAALNFLADKLENQLDDTGKKVLCFASKVMSSFEMDMKEEDLNEINNEESQK